jgi:hypothetical protein
MLSWFDIFDEAISVVGARFHLVPQPFAPHRVQKGASTPAFALIRVSIRENSRSKKAPSPAGIPPSLRAHSRIHSRKFAFQKKHWREPLLRAIHLCHLWTTLSSGLARPLARGATQSVSSVSSVDHPPGGLARPLTRASPPAFAEIRFPKKRSQLRIFPYQNNRRDSGHSALFPIFGE